MGCLVICPSSPAAIPQIFPRNNRGREHAVPVHSRSREKESAAERPPGQLASSNQNRLLARRSTSVENALAAVDAGASGGRRRPDQTAERHWQPCSPAGGPARYPDRLRGLPGTSRPLPPIRPGASTPPREPGRPPGGRRNPPRLKDPPGSAG